MTDKLHVIYHINNSLVAFYKLIQNDNLPTCSYTVCPLTYLRSNKKHLLYKNFGVISAHGKVT